MSDPLRLLLAAAPPAAARAAARHAWAVETLAAWREAHRKVDAAWARVLADLPDDLDEEELEALDLPDPPEQADLDRLHAAIMAVVNEDKWPRELYWGCL